MPQTLPAVWHTAVFADVIEPTQPAVAVVLAVTKFVTDTGLILTSGLLVVALAMLNRAGVLSEDARALIRASRATAALTALATALFAYATSADVMAVGLADIARNPAVLESLLTQTSLGQSLLWQIGLLIAYGALCPLATRTSAALALSLPLFGTVIARATSGHSGNSSWHMAAIEAWAIHIAALCVWMGTIVVLAWTHLRGTFVEAWNAHARITRVLHVCMTLVLLSGTASAVVRLGAPLDLFVTRYGLLVSLKAALSIALILGARKLLKRTSAEETPRRWLLTQASLFTITTVAAVALSRTAPPFNPDASVGTFSPLRQTLGFPPPPRPSASDVLWAQVRPDVFWLFVAGLGSWLYLRGAKTLRRRGDTWSNGRTFAWLAGMGVLTYATSGSLGVYGHIFFSAHMAQHLLLVMVSPLLLVVAAPMTLALRALPANRDHTGAREWLLAVLHSRYLRIVSHPLLAFLNFVGGFFALYFSGLFELLMRSHTGHLLMQVHFLVSGYLFFLAVIGTDPAPRTLPAPARAGLALLAAPFHAVFSVIVMQSTAVIAATYFEQFADAYRSNPLHDQYVGSSLGWAFGEVPMVIVIIIAVTQWVRADAREAARFDRWDDEQRAREAASASE